MALIQEYFQLSQQYQQEYGPQTVLLMQVGSFFECYGLRDKETQEIDAAVSPLQMFSQMCDLNVAEKNVAVGGRAVVMAGFKDMMLDKYVRKALREQRKLASVRRALSSKPRRKSAKKS